MSHVLCPILTLVGLQELDTECGTGSTIDYWSTKYPRYLIQPYHRSIEFHQNHENSRRFLDFNQNLNYILYTVYSSSLWCKYRFTQLPWRDQMHCHKNSGGPKWRTSAKNTPPHPLPKMLGKSNFLILIGRNLKKIIQKNCPCCV